MRKRETKKMEDIAAAWAQGTQSFHRKQAGTGKNSIKIKTSFPRLDLPLKVPSGLTEKKVNHVLGKLSKAQLTYFWLKSAFSLDTSPQTFTQY